MFRKKEFRLWSELLIPTYCSIGFWYHAIQKNVRFYIFLLIKKFIPKYSNSISWLISGFFWHIDSLHFDANFTLSGDRNNCKWHEMQCIALWTKYDPKMADCLTFGTTIVHNAGNECSTVLWKWKKSVQKKQLKEMNSFKVFAFKNWTFVYKMAKIWKKEMLLSIWLQFFPVFRALWVHSTL